jgi:hypothetical protein
VSKLTILSINHFFVWLHVTARSRVKGRMSEDVKCLASFSKMHGRLQWISMDLMCGVKLHSGISELLPNDVK